MNNLSLTLHRVRKGLWLHSHAALCAEAFGIPRGVVRRATYVRYATRKVLVFTLSDLLSYSHLLSRHELGQLLDEEMDAEERAELAAAEEVCRKFLAWDLTGEGGGEVVEGGVKAKLREVLGRTAEGEDEDPAA